MTTFSEFVKRAKDDYARVEAELKEAEQKIKDAGYAFLDPRAEHDGEALLQ